jgi:hypothetical protein
MILLQFSQKLLVILTHNSIMCSHRKSLFSRTSPIGLLKSGNETPKSSDHNIDPGTRLRVGVSIKCWPALAENLFELFGTESVKQKLSNRAREAVVTKKVLFIKKESPVPAAKA